jgi:hypothetical protein
MRADHSLLGGVWIGEKAFGQEIGDSIYTAFVLQEAIRLVKRERVDEGDEHALIMCVDYLHLPLVRLTVVRSAASVRASPHNL